MDVCKLKYITQNNLTNLTVICNYWSKIWWTANPNITGSTIFSSLMSASGTQAYKMGSLISISHCGII